MDKAASEREPDAEVAELIDRFERIYASLGPDEVEPESTSSPTALFGDGDFELPLGTDERSEPAGSAERVNAVANGAARSGQIEPSLNERAAARSEPEHAETADELDLEEAFALLRGGENKARSGVTPRAADPDADAEAESPAELPPGRSERSAVQPKAANNYRRFAVPALAAMLFMGVATGYVIIRQNDSSSATSAQSAAPSAPLRLDYQLQQQPRRDALAARPR
jgi:hypothetical protein